MSTTDTPATAPDTENPTIWKPQPLHVIGTADDEGFHDGKAADFFDGGDGTDTVVFGGRWEEYRVEYDAGRDAWTVARHDKTPDNADVLVNVERLSFFDVEAPIAPGEPRARTIWQAAAGTTGCRRATATTCWPAARATTC
jgi:hypothetical protein